MLLHLPNLLTPDELKWAHEVLNGAAWADGRNTAGNQAVHAKNNQQLPEGSKEVQLLRDLVLRGLERHAIFFSASLPKHVSPPMFNRYGGETNRYDNHVDSAIRYLPGGVGRIRTDISCTLFLSDPASYDGGELVINELFNSQRIKLAAGDMVLYPGTSVHRVEPVTRGHRTACFFWIQSMVRSTEQRKLLFDMDQHLMHLRGSLGETEPAIVGLTGTYHNLLRMWADT
jgi:PKHD-type hydroxylase